MDWRAKFRNDIEFAFMMYGSSVQDLMLSGSGNEIAGTADFLRILPDDRSKAESVEDSCRFGQPDDIITYIIGAYKNVIVTFRAHNPTATVFCHNYDHAWPTGKGPFGPAD